MHMIAILADLTTFFVKSTTPLNVHFIASTVSFVFSSFIWNLDLDKSHPTSHIATFSNSFIKFIAFLVPLYSAHSFNTNLNVHIHRLLQIYHSCRTLLLSSFTLNVTQPLVASVKSAILTKWAYLERMVVVKRFRQRSLFNAYNWKAAYENVTKTTNLWPCTGFVH